MVSKLQSRRLTELLRANQAPLVRAATLGLSVVMNLVFLKVAGHELGLKQFGTLSVGMSAGAAMQLLDGGIQARLVAIGSGSSMSTSRRVGRHWYTALALVSACMAVVVFALIWVAYTSRQTQPAGAAIAIAIILVGAIIANSGGVALSELLSTGRVSTYYICNFTLPAAQLAGGICIAFVGGGLVALSSAFAIALIFPALTARAAILKDERQREDTAAARSVGSVILSSAPIGIRQVTNLLAFGFTPLLAGTIGGAVAAAQVTLPFRVYTACWSVIGVTYHVAWAPMASLNAVKNRAGMRDLSLRVSRRGLISACLLAATACPIGLLIERSIIGHTRGDVAVFITAGLALIVRSAFLGPGLICTTIGPGFRMPVIEIGAVLLADAAAISAWHGDAAIISVATLGLASFVTGATTTIQARNKSTYEARHVGRQPGRFASR